ncbi:MAG: oligosaccharide flippase family protein [Chloroflexi bacterium]|nr:oligosaccharide flippase family protein [Chloroflexota bacterium]
MNSLVKRLLEQRDVLAALALLLIPLLFLWQGALAGKALLPADDLYDFLLWRPYGRELGVGISQNPLAADMVLQNYGWKEHLKATLGSGELPLWNPYIFTGMPFLAEGQNAALYPLGLPLFLLLPTAQAYVWYSTLHLFLGGLFTYLLLRALGAGRWGSLLSGAAFSLMGFLTVSFQWPQVLGVAIWLPWLLLCLERAFQRAEGAPAGPPESSRLRWLGTPFWTLAGAAGVALQFLGGHLEISFYLLFTLLAYSLFRLGLMLRRDGLSWPACKAAAAGLGMVIIGGALAGVQLVPFAELAQSTVRAGQGSLELVQSRALPGLQWVAFLLPDFFGNPTHHDYFDVVQGALLPVQGSLDAAGSPRSYPFWGQRDYVEGTAYLGLLPLLLAGAALLLRRDATTWFFAGYGAFALLLAFGSPLYGPFYRIPGFEQVHSPFRWVFPYSFCVIVLAGQGADALLRGLGPPDRAAVRRRAAALAVSALVAGALALAGLALSRATLPFALEQAQRLLDRSTALAAAFPSAEMLYSYQFRNFLLFGLLLLLSSGALLLALARPRRLGPLALLAVTVGDLALFGWGFLTFTAPELMAFTPPALRWLRQDSEVFRVVTFGPGDTLPPNSGMLAGLQDIRGYDSMIPRQYVGFWRLLEEPEGLRYSQISRLAQPQSLDSPLLDLMNVKYVLSGAPLVRPGWTLVYDAEVKVYQNQDVLPRAFAVFDARQVPDLETALQAMGSPGYDPGRMVLLQGEAALLSGGAPSTVWQPGRVLRYEANRVVVAIRMPQAGYLVLGDAFFPGWQARDEAGRALPVLRANGVFRAVHLGQGEHTVTFAYAPESLRLGLYLSFLGAVALVLTAAYWAWQGLALGAAATTGVQRVVKNSLTPMAGQALTRAVDLGFAIVMLRLLGPTSYGGYAFAVALIGYFTILTDFGLGTLLTRDVARDPAQANRYLVNGALARVGLWLASAPVLLGVALLYHWLFGLSPEAVGATLLFMVSLAPSGLAGMLSALFSAHERMEYQALISVGASVVRASLGVAALLLGWGVLGLGAVSVASSVAMMLAYLLVASRTLPRLRLEADTGFIRGMIRTAAPLMLNNLLNTLFFRVDMMLLQPLRGAEAVGLYSTAYKFVDGLLMVPSFFTLALFPVMARFAQQSPERLAPAYVRGLKALLLVALPVTVWITVTAEQLILLFFGEAYAPAAGALRILIWFLPFSYVNGITQYVLIAANQQRTITGAFALAAAFNVVANLMAIPALGIDGAAVVTVLSELVLMAPFLRAVRRHVGPLPIGALALRPVAATALMGLTLWSLSHLPLAALTLLGAGVYAAALWALRVFDQEDRAILRSILAR